MDEDELIDLFQARLDELPRLESDQNRTFVERQAEAQMASVSYATRETRLVDALREELGGNVWVSPQQDAFQLGIDWRPEGSQVVAHYVIDRGLLREPNIDVYNMVLNELRRLMFDAPRQERIYGDTPQAALGLQYGDAVMNSNGDIIGRLEEFSMDVRNDVSRPAPDIILNLRLRINSGDILRTQARREADYETILDWHTRNMRSMSSQELRDVLANVVGETRDPLRRTTNRAGTPIRDEDLLAHPELSPEPFSISEFFNEE